MQWVSLRFILALVATHLLLAAVWLRDALSSNELYSFLLGALVSLQSAIHVRHVALRIEGGREHVRGTELHTKATGLAPLNDDRNPSFCHEIPQPNHDDHCEIQSRRM